MPDTPTPETPAELAAEIRRLDALGLDWNHELDRLESLATLAASSTAPEPSPADAGLLRLLCDIRFAVGDNGKRMQDELVAYLKQMRADAEAYRAASSTAPAGFVLVPVEPTEAMLDAAHALPDVMSVGDEWRAMLAAAPAAAERKPLTAGELHEPKNGSGWRVEWWNESARLMLPTDMKLDSFDAYRNGTLVFRIKVAHGITAAPAGSEGE